MSIAYSVVSMAIIDFNGFYFIPTANVDMMSIHCMIKQI
jgi:hypothetical protein